MQRKFYFLTVLLFFISFGVRAQSGFSVGAFVAPTLTNIGYTFYNQSKYDKSFTFGINIDYAVNKTWIISLRPSYSRLNFSSDCVDTVDSKVYISSSNSLLSPYYVSWVNNCLFSDHSSIDYIEVPILICYRFKSHKWDKLREYIFVGNTFRNYFNYLHLLINTRTNEKINADYYTFQRDFILLFPTFGGGFEYFINSKLNFYSDICYKTQSNHYFEGFSFGLNVGIKARL